MGCSNGKTDDIVVTHREKKEETFHEKYILQRLIGNGAFAQVWQIFNTQLEFKCAVKILDLRDKTKLSNGTSPNERRNPVKLVLDFKHELDIWRTVGDHPNCVKLYDSSMDLSFGYLAMELCKYTLLKQLRSEPELTEHTLVHYFTHMVTALQHMHQLGLVHRDVKQDNFLLGGSDGKTVKLCDFGLSANVPAYGKLTGVFGSSPYMSPEMVRPNGTHGTATDIWSFGVIVYSHFFGCFPYSPEKKNDDAMREVIRNGVPVPAFTPPRRFRSESVSPQALAFVMVLLGREAAERPSASQVLQMEYLANAKVLAVEAKKADSPPASLVPMLYGAVRAGALSTRPPRPNPSIDQPLMELQRKTRIAYILADSRPYIPRDVPDSSISVRRTSFDAALAKTSEPFESDSTDSTASGD